MAGPIFSTRNFICEVAKTPLSGADILALRLEIFLWAQQWMSKGIAPSIIGHAASCGLCLRTFAKHDPGMLKAARRKWLMAGESDTPPEYNYTVHRPIESHDFSGETHRHTSVSLIYGLATGQIPTGPWCYVIAGIFEKQDEGKDLSGDNAGSLPYTFAHASLQSLYARQEQLRQKAKEERKAARKASADADHASKKTSEGVTDINEIDEDVYLTAEESSDEAWEDAEEFEETAEEEAERMDAQRRRHAEALARGEVRESHGVCGAHYNYGRGRPQTSQLARRPTADMPPEVDLKWLLTGVTIGSSYLLFEWATGVALTDFDRLICLCAMLICFLRGMGAPLPLF